MAKSTSEGVKRGKQLSTRLFVPRDGSRGTVTLNRFDRPIAEAELIARGFHATGREAARHLKRSRCGLSGTEVFRAYPIVFLYRHSLELYLKAIIWTGRTLLAAGETRRVDSVLNQHRLPPLVRYVGQIFKALGAGWNLGTRRFRTLANFQRVIDDFESVDSASFAFRYPTKKNGDPGIRPYFRFDVPEFCAILDELLPVLDGSVTMVYQGVQDCLQNMEAPDDRGYLEN